MLISYDPAFLFIHVDKAAGSSIDVALQPFAPPKTLSRFRRRLVWLGPLNRFGQLYRQCEFPPHVIAQTVRRCLPPELFRRMYKFAFVRNPWDRLVSRYSYLRHRDDHPRHKLVSRMSGFEEYLEWELRRAKMSQHSYVTDAEGRWLVDFIGYYERLPQDFERVANWLGLPAELRKQNSSSHKDYRSYYTPATRDLVAREFQRDIELFGYEFDGLPATSQPKNFTPRPKTV